MYANKERHAQNLVFSLAKFCSVLEYITTPRSPNHMIWLCVVMSESMKKT